MRRLPMMLILGGFLAGILAGAQASSQAAAAGPPPGARIAAAPDGDRAAVQKTIASGADLSSRGREVLFRARVRLENGDAAGAAEVLDRWLDGHPDRDHALLCFERAVARTALDRPDSALVDLRRAVSLEPRFANAWLKLGELAYGAGRYAEAAEAFGHGYELAPDPDPELLHYRGVCLLLADRPAAAAEVLADLVRDHREQATLEWYRALVAADLACDRPGRATPLLDVMVEDFPSAPEAWDLVARHAAARQDYRQAAVALTIADYLEPLDPDRLRQLGDLYAACGVPLQAARCYDRALAQPPAEAEPDTAATRRRREDIARLATAWLAAHQPDAARAVLEAATATDPGFGRAWLLLGYAALDRDDADAARRAWSRAQADPAVRDEATRLVEALSSQGFMGP